MMEKRGSSPEASAGDASAGRFPELLGRLLAQHFQLLRVELAQDGRAFAISAAKIVIFLPFMLVGYSLLCVGGALCLARVLPTDAAVASVAAANLLLGGGGIALAIRAMKGRRPLAGFQAEARQSALALKAAVRGEASRGA